MDRQSPRHTKLGVQRAEGPTQPLRVAKPPVTYPPLQPRLDRMMHKWHSLHGEPQYLEPHSIGPLEHGGFDQGTTMRMFWTNCCNQLATGERVPGS